MFQARAKKKERSQGLIFSFFKYIFSKEEEMELKEVISNTFKELILPELGRIKEENKEIKNYLSFINKRLDDVNRRLDDVNIHLADQSRRIDETNKRIDRVREELNTRIDAIHADLLKRIDEVNYRLNRLYEVIVRRDEHTQLEQRVLRLEQEVEEIRRKIAT